MAAATAASSANGLAGKRSGAYRDGSTKGLSPVSMSSASMRPRPGPWVTPDSLSPATTYSPGTPTSLDSGLRTVADEPYGPPLIIALALGLVAFGIYCFFDARYRKA